LKEAHVYDYIVLHKLLRKKNAAIHRFSLHIYCLGDLKAAENNYPFTALLPLDAVNGNAADSDDFDAYPDHSFISMQI
jgi:hypothetical protein